MQIFHIMYRLQLMRTYTQWVVLLFENNCEKLNKFLLLKILLDFMEYFYTIFIGTN